MYTKEQKARKAAIKSLYYKTRTEANLKGFAPIPGFYKIKNLISAGISNYAWANWKAGQQDNFVEEALFKINVSCLYNIESIGPKEIHPMTTLGTQVIFIKSVVYNTGYKVEWDTISGDYAKEADNLPNYAFGSPDVADAEAYNYQYAIAEANSFDNIDIDEENAIASMLEGYDEQLLINEEISETLEQADDELAIIVAENINQQAIDDSDE